MTELETHPAASETRLCEKVFPKQANHYGTLFGGTAPSLMGKAAFIAASHHARAAVAMARSEQIAFHHPVSVVQLVELHAYIALDGRSSMTVEVEMISETLSTAHRSQAVKGQFEMVSVDEHGKPKPYRQLGSGLIAAARR